MKRGCPEGRATDEALTFRAAQAVWASLIALWFALTRFGPALLAGLLCVSEWFYGVLAVH